VHAHTNPLADKAYDYPLRPELMDWASVFPGAEGRRVRIVDVGCAWGGLIVALAERFRDELVLGLEIRERVVEYTRDRLAKLRLEHPGQYGNVAALMCNCMKSMPNYFAQAQLTKLFFTFPDPHFKKCKQRRRIINPALLAEYAYFLADNAVLYTITDVEALHQWMASCLDAHPLFARLTDAELAADPCVELIRTATEEAKKVERNKGMKFPAIYRRIPRGTTK
jgi:tRNA (guanine-N7-)-methyltransferase